MILSIVADPPGVKACPGPMKNCVTASGSKVLKPIARIGSGRWITDAISNWVTGLTSYDRSEVELPITGAVAEGARNIVVLGPIMTGAPPGCSVRVPTTTTEDGPSTTGAVPKVPTLCCYPGLTFCGSGNRAPLTTIAVDEGPKATDVPLTVMTGPPGFRVCEPATTTDDKPTTTGPVPTVPTIFPIDDLGCTAVVPFSDPITSPGFAVGAESSVPLVNGLSGSVLVSERSQSVMMCGCILVKV